MSTIFERSVLRTFLYVAFVCLIAIVGLFVVIDLFDNADDFQSHGQGFGEAFARMLHYYGRMALFIFDSTATVLIAVSGIVVLLMLKRRQELRPLLAAGVPTYRVLVPPLVVGTLIIVGAKAANREFLLDRFVHELHEHRGSESATGHAIEPMYDHQSLILVDGRVLYPKEARIERATFVLPQPSVAAQVTIVNALVAVYGYADQYQASGWLLKDASITQEDINLTPKGKTYVHQIPGSTDLFIATDIGPDLLYRGKQNASYLGTPTLLRRVKSSVLDPDSLSKLTSILHSRFVEPLLNIASVLLAIPLIMRKDSRSMITNVLQAGGVFFCIYMLSIFCSTFAQIGILSAQFAAWCPIFISGSLCSWFMGTVET